MLKQKKNILLVLLAIIIISGAVGFYMFNKGPLDVKNAKAVKIGSVELYAVWLQDSVVAKKTYADKIMEVSGLVKKVSKNLQDQVIVMLQTNEAGAYVNCTMEEKGTRLSENEQVTLKGICTGMGMGDPDLGILGDVYLIRCYLTSE
jgi:hypothetical protein